MDELGGNLADETSEMVSERAVNASTELRKRRSTRIVQAVPLVVTGVDALGRPFVERTSSLIINCHGCRYQSKHYVLKNMWVSLEIPHPSTGQAPRSVRGRVAWIQRPRTVRQLFQVALELEVPGNAWGIAFPPEDWFGFPDATQPGVKSEAVHEPAHMEPPPGESGSNMPLGESELPPAIGSDNLRVFPSPGSATDASLQLARQVARLLADAKQQIQTAAREAASHAVSAEHRLSFEQWEQKFAAARAEVANEASRAIERIQQDTTEHARSANAAAAEALKIDLPRWLSPELEQLTRELTARLSKEGAAQRDDHLQQLSATAEHLRAVRQQAEEAAARIKSQTEQAEAQLAERIASSTQAAAETARQHGEATARLKAQADEAQAQIAANAEASTRALEEAAHRHEQAVASHQEFLNSAASEMQQQLAAALSSAQANWQSQLAGELEAAQARWHCTLENTLALSQERAASGLIEHGRALVAQLQQEMTRHAASLRDSTAGSASETEQRLNALRQALDQQSQRLEEALARAGESSAHLDQYPSRIEAAQQQAIGGFQSQLDDVLSVHRNELHRRSDSLYEELSARIRATFDDSTHQALTNFEQQVAAVAQPHITGAEEMIHRLAGGRSLLDAAMTLQQERIRATADESFAESLARFRENLGGVDHLLQESAQSAIAKNLSDFESKVGDFKHQAVEDIFKSAEWYEKKAQTQIQNTTEKFVDQAGNQLREKAGEISSVFASELDHSSRNFVGHAQRQMEEVVRESFERSRSLFAEVADTTAAAFTDEIQRTARQELNGYGEELQRAALETRTHLDTTRSEISEQLSAEQQNFLARFQGAMSATMEASVIEAQQRVQAGFGPLLDSWKSMTDAHQQEMRGIYSQIGEQAAAQHQTRLENVSNQWLLATVASLDHQSRDVVSNFSAMAQEKLRETSTQVFAEIGEALRERLQQIAQSITAPPTDPSPLSRSATNSC